MMSLTVSGSSHVWLNLPNLSCSSKNWHKNQPSNCRNWDAVRSVWQGAKQGDISRKNWAGSTPAAFHTLGKTEFDWIQQLPQLKTAQPWAENALPDWGATRFWVGKLEDGYPTPILWASLWLSCLPACETQTDPGVGRRSPERKTTRSGRRNSMDYSPWECKVVFWLSISLSLWVKTYSSMKC